MEAEGKKNTDIQTCGFDGLMLMSPKVLGRRGSTKLQQTCPLRIRSVTLSPDALSPDTLFLMRRPLLSGRMRSSDTLVLMHM